MTRADVYFDIRGGGEVTHLLHDATSVRIGLDREFACGLEQGLCNHPTFAARLLLDADGLVPVSSDLFDRMAAAAPSLDQSVQIRSLRVSTRATTEIREPRTENHEPRTLEPEP